VNKHLIAFTGAHRAIRQIAEETLDSFEGFSYYRALEDSLRANAVCKPWDPCQVFDELLMFKEFERDGLILSSLEADSRCALIEQWHIGNLAAARVRSPNVVQVYEEKLIEQLSRLESVGVVVFYVSTDLGKISTMPMREFYEKYLEQLTAIEKRLGFPVHTIDGEVLPESIKNRLCHLLRRIMASSTKNDPLG
jgi:hypothetical protein